MSTTNQNQLVQDPFAQKGKDFNQMTPGNKSPEEQERLDKIRDEFYKSEEYEKLKDYIWEENNDFLERVVTFYEKDENLESAIEKACNNLHLSEEEKSELIENLLSEIENDNKDQEKKPETEDENENQSFRLLGKNPYKRNNELEENQEIDTSKELKRHPDFPVINRLKEIGIISQELMESIEKNFNGDMNESISNAVKELWLDQDESEKILEQIYTKLEKNEKENQESFREDFWKVFEKLYSEKNKYGIVLSNDEKDRWTAMYMRSEILTKLAGNYRKPETENNIINENFALNEAFDITINEIIAGKKNLDQDKIKDFRENIHKEKDPIEKFKTIIELNSYVNTAEWILAYKPRKTKSRELLKKSKTLAELKIKLNEAAKEIPKIIERNEEKWSEEKKQEAEELYEKAIWNKETNDPGVLDELISEINSFLNDNKS